MKCLNCGCEKLVPVSMYDFNLLADCGDVNQNVNAYACEKCGHVELFVSKETIEKEKKGHNKNPGTMRGGYKIR